MYVPIHSSLSYFQALLSFCPPLIAFFLLYPHIVCRAPDPADDSELESLEEEFLEEEYQSHVETPMNDTGIPRMRFLPSTLHAIPH
jgi:hypothetical protein